MNWYISVVAENYANFNGRARRKEYWMFLLFHMIFVIVAMVLDNLLGLDFKMDAGSYAVSMGYGWIYSVYTLAILIPSLAVAVRRLHDVGKSGWFLLITLIPLIGGIWCLILMCTDGDVQDNEYGSSPKA